MIGFNLEQAVEVSFRERLASPIRGLFERGRARPETTRLLAGAVVTASTVICLVVWTTRDTRTNPERIKDVEPQLRAFFGEKEEQARALAKRDGAEVSSKVRTYFAAAAKGDWRKVTRLYFQMASQLLPI